MFSLVSDKPAAESKYVFGVVAFLFNTACYADE
jgi:hypothetical protein